jgi:hypothetical protein
MSIRWSENMVVSWQEFEQAQPELAIFGKKRIDGKVAYLAMLSEDNGVGLAEGFWPRIRPITPIIGAGKCFIFFDPDSKRFQNVERNKRFSLHCGMSDSSGSSGEFQMIGEARRIDSPQEREAAESVSSFKPAGRFQLFELMLCVVVSTFYKGGRAQRQRWSSEDS